MSTLQRTFFHPQNAGFRQLRLDSSDSILGLTLQADGTFDGSGLWLNEVASTPADGARLFRLASLTLADAGWHLAAAADERRIVARPLLPPRRKPEWQTALDETYLAVVAGDGDARIAGLLSRKTQREGEPFLACIRALHVAETSNDTEAALGAIRIARVALEATWNDDQAYLWTFNPAQLLSRLALLEMDQIESSRHDPRPGDAAALELVQLAARALDLDPSQETIFRLADAQFRFAPDLVEDAFDTAWDNDGMPGFEAIRADARFATYRQRREKQIKSGRMAFRWAATCTPSTANEIRATEAALDTALADDYRRFLLAKGRIDLVVYGSIDDPSRSRVLKFAGAEALRRWQPVFRHWVDTVHSWDSAKADFRAAAGVDADRLIAFATPWDNSRCFLLEAADRGGAGRCFYWDHDDPGRLDLVAAGFEAALTRITGGISAGDPAVDAMLEPT